MDFNWYPGQMEKTKRTLRENIKLVDLVIEVVDARIPAASHNPDLDLLTKNRPRLVVLNKADLAERAVTRDWIDYLKQKEGVVAAAVNSKEAEGTYNLLRLLKEVVPEKGKRLRRPLRAMVVGIPNVGKSTLVNRLTRGSAARTGNKPGITRGKQWIRIHNELELLDTPGILWPKLTGEELGFHLAAVGAIQEDVYDPVAIALWLLGPLVARKAVRFRHRYQLEQINLGSPQELLEVIGKSKGCLAPGGQIDLHRAAVALLQDFRQGRLGPLSLEFPPLGSTGENPAGQEENHGE